MAEKILVRSFSTVQMQCYFLLKMVSTYLIKPYVKDGLCSYHIKTVMFHVVENTDPREWRKDNIINCFMTCLGKLLDCLKDGYLPQYFILTHNLFVPKVQGPTRQRLLSIVDELYKEGWSCVLRCTPFINNLIKCDHHYTRCPCFVNYGQRDAAVFGTSDILNALIVLGVNRLLILQRNSSTDITETIQRLESIAFDDEALDARYFPCKMTSSMQRRMLKRHIGYSLLNVTRQQPLANNRKIYKLLKIGEQLLKENCDIDVTSCRLKLATFYLQTGTLHKCIQTVDDVLVRYFRNVKPVCPHAYRWEKYTTETYMEAVVGQLAESACDFSSVVKQVAFPVSFSPWEILCAPPVVLELAYTRQQPTLCDRLLFKIVTIDPLPYAYSLLVMAFLEMNKPEEAARHLQTMQRIVINPEGYMLFYPDIDILLYEICSRLFAYKL